MTLSVRDDGPHPLRWFKSTHSPSDSNECVEVAVTPAAVHVRDSTRPDGPHLHLDPTTWAAFLTRATSR
ncbi:DUF397 domain-containing protein [Streptomyces sp. 549]|uniref:DUF397 domain-containing protein n=1 Tax=Streptomyces sp. 549 TaxID=3049076 RepID=UPI0024C2BFB9|nr:DUF397 domain-containing protein [Streptomyces sp. 549]MDK1475303.1 DUF397 domain-containing protein [Streptomyces sp. 549]